MALVDGFLFTLTFVTTLGCGLIAGLFFAFSVAVMQALARLPVAWGIAAMQSINSAILNPLFLDIAVRWQAQGDIPRAVLEGAALEAYRQRIIGESRLRQWLGFAQFIAVCSS